MEVDVRAETELESRPAGQEPAHEVEGDPVDLRSEEPAHPDVAPGHQRQRPEEVLAELAIGDPRSAGLVGLEREMVDVHRAGAEELDVERARVAQREALAQGGELEIEGQEG